jgi:hypothetical protein
VELTESADKLFDLGDEALLDALQRAAFGYFDAATERSNGLVADSSREGAPVSIAVVGFALSCYPIAVQRGWLTRDDAAARALAALRFFARSDQSGAANATGCRGFYYHFLDRHSGRRVWSSELSMIDSAFLIAGALAASAYFDAPRADEREVRELADALYRRMDWSWALDGGNTIRQGWKPESGFLNYAWKGYSEAILLYVLALASPTHAIDPESYCSWTATYQWENQYGIDLLFAGPLFVHQFSHAWIDFRSIRDRFMRDKSCDYFENSARATLVQREYARRNPHRFAAYGEDCWGLTACDGPGGAGPEKAAETASDEIDRHRRAFGYAARGVPHGPDDGTLSGWAPIASLPFAPEIAMRAVRAMGTRFPEMVPSSRYASGFNPTLAQSDGRAWVSAGHFGLDQGIVVMMIENHRTGSLWRSMRECPIVRAGLERADFRSGWL